MTLRGLIDAVEQGEVGWNRLATIAEDAMPPREAALAATAYSGSLDAAMRLHDALLPGWAMDEMGQRAGGWVVRLGRFDGRKPRSGPEGRSKDNPARAWLLAILRALESDARALEGGGE